MEKKDKKKKILKVSGLVALFLVVFGLSYALFTVTLNGTKKVKIKTGKLELQLLDSENNPIYVTGQNNESSFAINLDNQVPVDDATGLSTEGFTFKLKNTGSIDARYTIYLDDVALESGENRLPDSAVRYSLTKNESEENPSDLTSVGTNPNRKLDEGVIKKDTTNTYTLKVWIDEDAGNEAMNKVFNTTLRVEGSQYVEPKVDYGEKIAEKQISDTITATYYQPEGTGYNSNSSVKRMSNVEKIDNEERYEGGTLVISGEGEIPSDSDIVLFLANVSSWDDVQSNSNEEYILYYNPETLIIDTGITRIGSYVFAGIHSIRNIRLSSTVTNLGEAAFYDMYLNVVYLPSSVSEIGELVFTTAWQSFTIYCETQDVANLLRTDSTYDDNQNYLQENIEEEYATVIVDPTKFE